MIFASIFDDDDKNILVTVGLTEFFIVLCIFILLYIFQKKNERLPIELPRCDSYINNICRDAWNNNTSFIGAAEYDVLYELTNNNTSFIEAAEYDVLHALTNNNTSFIVAAEYDVRYALTNNNTSSLVAAEWCSLRTKNDNTSFIVAAVHECSLPSIIRHVSLIHSRDRRLV